MYINDIKKIGILCTSSENIQWRNSDGIGIEKCVMLIMKNRKGQMMKGIELQNQEKFKTLGEKETYKYLAILEADIIKQAEIKEKI